MTAVTDRLRAEHARNALPRTCDLERTLGQAGACPRHLCPFWEDGGAVIRPGCALSRTPLDLDRAPVADLLMGLRRRIQQPVSAEDQRQAQREFRRLLAAAFDDDWE
jgi:hypothetical protein